MELVKVTNAAGVTYLRDGLFEKAAAQAACQICGKGICKAGHEDEYPHRPRWEHVNGYRTCYEGDDIAVAMPY